MLQKLLFLLLLACNFSYAQTNLQSYIPSGDKLDTLTRGDLNKDGIDDIVMVSASKADDTQNVTVRTLIVLFGQPGGTYTLNTQSKTAVVGKNEYSYCFFSGIEIKKGILIIEHEYLRGGCKHLFRYQNGGFYLIGASSNTGDPTFNQSLEYNLSTGKYIAEYRNYETDKKTSTEGIHKPAKLPRIESYKLFSLEVNGESL